MPASTSLPEALRAAAQAVQDRCGLVPRVGLVLGSGLGDLADELDDACALAFRDIPHHPQATVAGHAGELVLGRLESVAVAVWRGRAHFYEGRTMAEVAFPARLLRELGGRALILTNAAGGLNESFRAGDLMLVADHLNLPGLMGHNPLRGNEADSLGERFVDLAEIYDGDLRRLAARVAQRLGLELQQGVYAMVAGPNYETPAEARMLRLLGADAVGMSTAPEAVAARQVGLRVAAISTITNVILGGPTGGTSHAEVLAAAEAAKPRLGALIRGMLSDMDEVLAG